MKIISLAGITCDLETEIFILTMYLKKYLKVFEKVKYFRIVFKYKYFEFLNIKHKYFEKKYLNTLVLSNTNVFYPCLQVTQVRFFILPLASVAECSHI